MVSYSSSHRRRRSYLIMGGIFLFSILTLHQNCGGGNDSGSFILPSSSPGGNSSMIIVYSNPSLTVPKTQASVTISGVCSALSSASNQINWDFKQVNTPASLLSGNSVCKS